MAYALAKAQASAPPAAGSANPPRTALAREGEAARTVLQIRQENPSSSSLFWDMMARAAQAGLLDEAIFVHLLDRDLVAEYRTYRDANRERLVRYVETVLAPLPPEPAH